MVSPRDTSSIFYLNRVEFLATFEYKEGIDLGWLL